MPLTDCHESVVWCFVPVVEILDCSSAKCEATERKNSNVRPRLTVPESMEVESMFLLNVRI